MCDQSKLAPPQTGNIWTTTHLLIMNPQEQEFNFSFFFHQGELVDVIGHSVRQTANFVHRGQQEMRRAVTYRRRAERVSVFVFGPYICSHFRVIMLKSKIISPIHILFSSSKT